MGVQIRHVLKDGRVLDDISGIVIKKEDCPEVYRVVEKIRREKRNNETKDKE